MDKLTDKLLELKELLEKSIDNPSEIIKKIEEVTLGPNSIFSLANYLNGKPS